jgi:DNA-binding HxlR family transcriptional regulator
MPKAPWTGYGRFCPLARALDVVGERWPLVIVQELLKRPCRYGELLARLPGIGTCVLADRLRTLERAGVVSRQPGSVGAGVVYTLTDCGRALDGALHELRCWGVGFLTDLTADGSTDQSFDVTYVEGIHTVPDGQFQLDIDGEPTPLRFTGGQLHQVPGVAPDPELTSAPPRPFSTTGRPARPTLDRTGGHRCLSRRCLSPSPTSSTRRAPHWPAPTSRPAPRWDSHVCRVAGAFSPPVITATAT